jgi:hypothetical protein
VSEPKNQQSELYSERVLPNLGTFLAFALLWPAITLVSEPFDLVIGLIAGFLAVATSWLALFLSAPRISVTSDALIINRATLDRAVIGELEHITRDNIFSERGPKLDFRAFTVFQGTVKEAVKIELKDPLDPTPYWLISTRRPTELIAALKK